MNESMIREFIKEALVEQEASLKDVISGHVEKLESQIQELKYLILNLQQQQPEALGRWIYGYNEPEEVVEEEEDATWKETPKFGGEDIKEWIHSCECYFEEKGISSDHEKVQIASLELHDDDDTWQQTYGSLTWKECADLLLAHYGAHQVISAPPASPPSWKYDVFISFRGGDTRRGFASHLFHALKNADINCYRDVDGNERGQVVWPMLRDAIHHSFIAIILFSKNYANSKWCLKELAEILRFNKQHGANGHTVLPIFYDVEPSQLRHQTGIVREAMQRCKTETKQQKEQWRDALREAGNISSWHLVNESEAEFIEKIVEDLQNRMFSSRSAYFVKSPVGIKDNVDHLISLLNTPNHGQGTTGIIKVVIYGVEGIGKTTLAKTICRQLYNDFEGRVSLLENIHKANINEEGIIRLQDKLVRDIMKIRRPLLSEDKGKNVSDIRKRLYQKKVLLVLDGVDKSHEMLSIIGAEPEKFLHPASVILITTRNKQLLDDLIVDKIDMIPPLDPQDSLQLFYQHASIEETEVCAEYEDMCKNIVHYAGGLPLALHTLGSFLFDKPKDEWHQILGKLVRSPRLDSVGIYANSVSPLYTYRKVGPYGGPGIPYDHGRLTTVRKVKLFLARVSEGNGITVHAMIVDYDYNGSFVSTGRSPGLEESAGYWPVTLDYPDEYLTSVSGFIEKNYQFGVIRSVKFYSNKRDFGPYGEEKGTPFSFPNIDSGCVVGFSGHRDSSFLNSIGAHFGPVPSPSPYTTAGPFGGGDGKRWDDGKHLDIRRINVLVGDSSVIRSICITYDNYGHPLGPFVHGDESGANVAHLVEVDYPYEYLTSISGYVTNGKDVVVRSLTFHSNRKKYGPFGDEIGQRFFTSQSTGVKIVGFFGGNDIGSGGLESIGVHLEAVSHIHPKRVVGPFGGESGEIWDHGDCCDDIQKMLVSWGSNGVISLSRADDDDDGYVSRSDFATSKLIQLDYPIEYIKAMEGRFSVESNGDAVIKQLTFESNIATYGPYGDTNDITYGTYFRTPWNVGKITGFYGRTHRGRLSSIGAYFGPVNHLYPLKTIGPFGDYFSGTQWDDGSHSDVRRINLRFGAVIDSIRLVYADENGDSVRRETHGSGGGGPTEIVLDYPIEYLAAMTGHVGTLGGHLCVRSLTFETNKRKLGPYGTEEGKYFSIRSNIGKIVGLYGSNSIYLYSIGAHIQLL